VEREDKNCASYNGSMRDNAEGIRVEPSVAPRPPISHRTREDNTNEHCTHYLLSVGGKIAVISCQDLDLPEDYHLITNRQEQI